MATTKVTTDVIDMSGNAGGLTWVKGTAAQQPSGTVGDLRENTETNRTEIYTDQTGSSEWRNLKESTLSFLVDFLVVAGGGGGSFDDAGGAGAGGLRTSFGADSGGGAFAESAKSLTTGAAYNVEVGAGGTGGTTSPTNGSQSLFDDITSNGGGAGDQSTSQSGGSGSGGSGNAATAEPGGAGTPNQGFAGGVGFPRTPPSTGNEGGGGGGGAGALGNDATASTGGDGGAGLEVNIIGGTGNFYAGGGGGGGRTTGGTGGTGGGGAGTAASNAGNGSDGKGGGGGTAGANSGSYSGGNGGAGIVILRYPDGYTLAASVGLGTGVLNGTVSGGTDKYTTLTSGTGTVTFS